MASDAVMAAERRAWWRRAGVGVMHGALWGFGFLPSRHRPLRSKEIRTLVFLHGWGSNRSAFYPLQAYLAFCGYRRQLSINYPSRTSIEAIALGVKREIDRQVRGGRIDLICHSMGGLVARFYVQFLGGERRFAPRAPCSAVSKHTLGLPRSKPIASRQNAT